MIQEVRDRIPIVTPKSTRMTEMKAKKIPRGAKVDRTCELCGVSFRVRVAEVKRGRGRFCSLSCSSKVKSQKIVRGRGPENPNWRGGQTKGTRGYWYVWKPEHPMASKLGYVKRANLVMEEKIGRFMVPGEVAHHENEQKDDDSPDNLRLMLTGDHLRLHHPKKYREPKPKREPKPPRIYKPDSPCNRRYSWPSDDELIAISSRLSLREIASKIGCSHVAVDRRLKKIKANG